MSTPDPEALAPGPEPGAAPPSRSRAPTPPPSKAAALFAAVDQQGGPDAAGPAPPPGAFDQDLLEAKDAAVAAAEARQSSGPAASASASTPSLDAIPAFVPARLAPPPPHRLQALMAPPDPPDSPTAAVVVAPSPHSFTAGYTPGRVRWGLPVVPAGAGDAALAPAGSTAAPGPPDTTAAAPPPPPYTPASPFTHVVELYRGAVSTVSSAVCGATGRPVILKAYDAGRMRPRHIARVRREVAAMTALGPGGGVVSLLGHFEAGPASPPPAPAATPPRRGASGGPVLVMEHCARGDLFKALVLAGGAGLGGTYAASSVVGPLLATLARAHAAGWVHRDIKPENLFVAADGRVLLGDWGLAMHTPTEPAFSRAGTLDYMAPEVLANPATDLEEGGGGGLGGGGGGGLPLAAALAAAGIKPYGPAVDVWAVGVLAYELVTGRPPFEAGGAGAGGRDDGATAARILHSTTLAWPSDAADADAGGARGAGPAWVAFVKACLAKDPARRPSAADALRLPWVAAHYGAPAGEAGHLLAGARLAGAGGGAAAARPASASAAGATAGPAAPPPPRRRPWSWRRAAAAGAGRRARPRHHTRPSLDLPTPSARSSAGRATAMPRLAAWAACASVSPTTSPGSGRRAGPGLACHRNVDGNGTGCGVCV